jgi:hypothetical protein
MVKGLCRGKMCDFWARIKIRKQSVQELVEHAREVIISYQTSDSMTLREVLDEYWKGFGIMDMGRLLDEEPDLFDKMREIEEIIMDTDKFHIDEHKILEKV